MKVFRWWKEKKRNISDEDIGTKIAYLDEIDSGLDVDAMQVVADVIKEQEKGRDFNHFSLRKIIWFNQTD